MSAKAQIRSKNQERVTFVIEGQDQETVLLAVAALFDELEIEIEAMWMIRAKGTRNQRISLTVKTEAEAQRKIEDYLSKIVGILSVKTESGGGRRKTLGFLAP